MFAAISVTFVVMAIAIAWLVFEHFRFVGDIRIIADALSDHEAAIQQLVKRANDSAPSPPESVKSIKMEGVRLQETSYLDDVVKFDLPATDCHYRRVQRFMHLASQNFPQRPTDLDDYTRILRARLILEECLETIRDGLGVAVSNNGDSITATTAPFVFTAVRPFNMTETIDGCMDIAVVTTGTLIACGVPNLALQEEVDLNNLAKFGPGGHRDANGKWIKPPNHPKPRLAEMLGEMGYVPGGYKQQESYNGKPCPGIAADAVTNGTP